MEATSVELVKYGASERRPDPLNASSEADRDVLAAARDVDPYEVAYLRGGEHEVMRLWLFELAERGVIEVREIQTGLGTSRWIALAQGSPPRETLSDDERELANWFVVPRRGSDIFTRPMPESLTSACDGYRVRLKEAGLITRCSAASPHLMWARAYRNMLAPGAALGAGAALYSMSVNLIVAAMASFVVFGLLRRGLERFGHPRLTVHGRSHLQELQAQLGALKNRSWEAGWSADPAAHRTAVGVFGISVLEGSPYDAFAMALASGHGGNWSIGNESDSGCGGDGDGGCGGCGGCGD